MPNHNKLSKDTLAIRAEIAYSTYEIIFVVFICFFMTLVIMKVSVEVILLASIPAAFKLYKAHSDTKRLSKAVQDFNDN